MTRIGANLDPEHGLTAADARRAGFGMVRVVLRDHVDLQPFLAECGTLRLQTLGVYAYESSFADGQPAPHEVMAGVYLQRYAGLLDYLQIGNEPDGAPGGSSWTMMPEDYAELVMAVAPGWRDHATLVGAGLVSGSLEWPSLLPASVWSQLDLVAVHPYGRSPDRDATRWRDLPGNFGAVDDLLDGYAGFLEQPLCVTEYGGRDNEMAPGLLRAYLQEMTAALIARQSAGRLAFACQFCLSDVMVPTFGALDATGALKWAARGMAALARAHA